MEFRFEADMREPVKQWLAERGFLVTVEMMVCGYADIVGGRFGARPASRRKPPLIECWVVELKLTDVAGVIEQARHNLHQSHRSFCAMPAARCDRMLPRTVDKFRAAGVGLLSVGDAIREIVPSSVGNGSKPHIANRLWRRTRELYTD